VRERIADKHFRGAAMPAQAYVSRSSLRVGRPLLLWLAVMAPLAWWGLPDRGTDALLFGGEAAWPAKRFEAQARAEQLAGREAGADTDVDPIPTRAGLVSLTEDDSARAAILLRYRLYSRQPDEMIVFRALQRMSPARGDFDPRLYQYGGAYLYLVGAGIAAAASVGALRLTHDVGFYLAEPEQFARFYLVGRFISLAFGAALLIVAARLGRRTGGRTAGRLAPLLVAVSPGFITGALEGKPHVPAACLILFATLSALRYHARARTRSAVWMGLQSGAAVAMVPTGLAAAALWPALLIGQPRDARRWRDLTLAAGIALAVYLVTNPYVWLHGLADSSALRSNVANSLSMYRVGQLGAGALRVGELIGEAGGWGTMLLGLAGALWLTARRTRRSLILCLAPLSVVVLCAAIGAGKPAEFARFLVLPVALLAVCAATLMVRIARRSAALGLVAAVLLAVTVPTGAYLRAFSVDALREHESRRQAAAWLESQVAKDAPIGVVQEPAPYSVPPIDFAHRQVVLLPATRPDALTLPELPGKLVLTADDDAALGGAWWRPLYELEGRFPDSSVRAAVISWADKPVYMLRLVGVDATGSDEAPHDAKRTPLDSNQ
jgi:hypothetical protein